MTITYSDSDLHSGMCFIAQKVEIPRDPSNGEASYIISKAYMLGYTVQRADKWTLISIADGWTRVFSSTEELLSELNNNFKILDKEFLGKCLAKR